MPGKGFEPSLAGLSDRCLFLLGYPDDLLPVRIDCDLKKYSRLFWLYFFSCRDEDGGAAAVNSQNAPGEIRTHTE